MILGENQPYELGDDPFDELLRQTLQRSTPVVQPPRRIWGQIRRQVRAGPARTSHRPPTERLSHLLAPFVQGLAAAVIVILVGVSLGSNRGIEPRQIDGTSPQSSPAVAAASAPRLLAASDQRMGRLAAMDDLDRGLSQIPVQSHAPQVNRMARERRTSGDSDHRLPPE